MTEQLINSYKAPYLFNNTKLKKNLPSQLIFSIFQFVNVIRILKLISP